MRSPRVAPSTPEAVRPLTPLEFEKISRLAYERFGLDLKRGKEELVSARLGKKLRQEGLRSFQEYYQSVLEDKTGEALVGLIDALTTNHTSFLREPPHFEFLREQALPEWRRRDTLRIWSAACSTGEEPYTIAFTLLEGIGNAYRPQLRILATDISTRVIAEAERAIYAAERIATLPAPWQRAYFLRGERRWQGYYCVKPEVRRLVEFRRLNLVEPVVQAETFAAIFCRNVMIYFDRPTQQAVVNRLAAHLELGGYLLIGHSESLTGIEHPLAYVRPTVYRRVIP
ncbi:MAG TPA: protein-glutamate O-methyltransferase [Bryobacteraceae bacterium]|nr:protein-glutamate O-methyltransferase [Bryobacteraceae bacterium]HUJ21752.1 protein-glutamate O-methyltransferase [Bryobacteraceae bacterium]